MKSPGHILISVLFMLLLAAHSLAQNAPECFPGGHRTLRNPYRSVDFDSTEIQNTAIQELVCDHSLAPGWYRFKIDNKPAEMPTTCVEMNRCGTQAPVWLSLKGKSLPRPGEVLQLSACATWQFFHGSTKDCCLFRIPITIRNCGNFLLYYLQPTQGCMGYCAQVAPTLAPGFCPPGEVEVNGRCKAALPSLQSRPIISSELIGYSIHLKCSFIPPVSSHLLGFHVVWARHIDHSMKAEIQIHQESTLKTFSLLEIDGVHFRLGETFSCSVSTFRVNVNHSRSSARKSEAFYAGLKFSVESLHIAENGEEHEVRIHSTVPLPCYGFNRCGVPLVLGVHEPDGLGHEVSNVVLSACQVQLRPTACSEGSCGQASFFITAVTDFMRDGNRISLISPLPENSTSHVWSSYTPISLKVIVQDVPTSVCYSLTDPHVITLDGRHYDNHQTGTFVLYRSLARDFEVHTRQWDCGSRHYAVACSCGIAAREGNDVATVDMCNGQQQETRPKLTVKGLDREHNGSRRVRVSHHGKKITIAFPSGAFVRADVDDWGMSLSVRAPSVDYGKTQGLCGTFDRNSNNDIHGYKGVHDDLHAFIEDWRIAPGESLFDKTPPGSRQEEMRPFCQCQKGYSSLSSSDEGVGHMSGLLTHSDCIAQENVDYTTLFPSLDTTLEYVTGLQRKGINLNVSSSQPLEGRGHHFSVHNDEEFEDDHSGSDDRLVRHKMFKFQSASQSISQADLEHLAYFFPEDHLVKAGLQVQPRWPTPSGLTSGKALEACHTALSNSTIGTVCRELLGRRLEEAVNLCILDLQLKDDLGWDEAMLPYLANECERKLLENRAQRNHGVLGHPGSPEEVVTALRCPNFCSGNGECTEFGCQCHRSFSSYDCSVTIGQPVELIGLENGGLCDLRTFDCRKVRVFGWGLIESPDLSCHATRLKYVNGVWLPGEKQRTRATFLSSKALDCDIPSLSSEAISTEDFMMDDKPYARWEIRVTNDGSHYSLAMALTIYDGSCQVCTESHSGICKLKDRTCNIDGMCFAEGDTNPGSLCLLCDPDTSKFTWSLNQVNQPPTFHQPQGELRTFAGENFVFQFAASDPEGSALLFQLVTGPKGAILSPAGLLIWRVPLPPDDKWIQSTIHFTLSDECNAQSTFKVQIHVVPCGCQNSGTCVTDFTYPAGSGKYLCVCPDGKEGALCHEDVDKCLSAPCAVGTCINTGGGFRCNCPEGLTGATCQEDIDECQRTPCFPGVHCLNSHGSYNCGPCPQGMPGNGTKCPVDMRPTTVTPRLAPETTVPKVKEVWMQSATAIPPRIQVAKIMPRAEPFGLPESPPTAWTRISLSAVLQIHTTSGTSKNTTRIAIDPVKAGPSQNSTTHEKKTTVVQNSGKPAAATCTSRPCFPGVPCINRRPPHVGYVCGRCPPGFHGNGRICMKSGKAASNHLSLEQKAGPKSRSSHISSKVSSPHLPPVPSRDGTKRLSVTRDAPLHRASPLGRGGGTGRRQVDTVDAVRSTMSAICTVAINRDNAIPSKGVVAPHVTDPKPSEQAAPYKVTPASPRIITQLGLLAKSLQTKPPLRNYFESRPWTRPARPLGVLSGSLPESELCADREAAVLTLTTPRHTPPLQSTSSIQALISNHMTEKEHILSCADQPCFPGVQCDTALDGSTRCGRCPVGFTGDGRMCRAICEPECLNGGACIAPGICQCPTGFHGETCQEAVCRVPCENGGTCTGLQTCSCPYGFVGPRCETMVCSRHCHNSGQCVSPDECKCQPGWSGPSCETALCSPVCLNGGLCIRPDICDCPLGFYGAHCQNAICTPPCKNGGLCMRNNVCSCLQGYTGTRCEQSVCEHMCINGGRCVGPNVCDCPSGWQGKSCDKPSCEQQCLNGAECVGPNTCHCTPGWGGMLCHIPQCQQKCLYGSRCVRPNVCACRSRFSGALCSRKLSI